MIVLSGIRRFGFRLYKPNEIIVMNVISRWKSGSILSIYENNIIWNHLKKYIKKKLYDVTMYDAV